MSESQVSRAFDSKTVADESKRSYDCDRASAGERSSEQASNSTSKQFDSMEEQDLAKKSVVESFRLLVN